MDDPLQTSDDRGPLFGTQHAAGEAAARASGSWRQRILARLSTTPSTTFELATHFGVTDNRISGRITDLAGEGYIETTGERRKNPETQCESEVWRWRRAGTDVTAAAEQLVNAVYPITLKIGEDFFDRQPLLRDEKYPGVPYARRADSGGMRLHVRVALVECEGCGKPLFQSSTSDPKQFRCGVCGRAWKCRVATVPGKAPMLALVMEEIS